MVDRVRPRKLEAPSTGGSQLDQFDTDLNPNEDFVDVRGVAIQNDTSDDESVVVSRDSSDNMTFEDGVTGPYTLSDLAASSSGITEAQHRAIRQLIHFLPDGPGIGWASGAYKETLPAEDPFPTSKIWWESSSKLKKIVELTINRNANKTPSTEVWKMYDTDGSTVLVTLTDTMGYGSSVFETTRTRTWTT